MKFRKRGKKRKERVKQRDSNPRLVLIRQIVVGVSLTTFIAGLGTGVWYGSRVEALSLTEVEVIGGETIAHEELRVIAEEALEGEYYKLVPRRFAWTYPEEKIEERILEIERIKNVEVERTSGRNITILFEEHRPFALWCEDTESAECLFIDREGYAFGAAPKLNGAAFIRFSESGTLPEKFMHGFDGAYIREAESFINRAYDELNLNIIHVEKTSEDEVTYHIAGGGQLKVSLRASTDDTIENLTTVLLSDEFVHIEPGNFQYIDLRYGNKIFVNEEEPSVEGEATSTASSTSTIE